MKKFLLKKSKQILILGLTGTAIGFSSNAMASGYQLFEQNAVNIGDMGAGGAAIAQDASTAYFNPAGLNRLSNQQFVISADWVNTSIKFNGTSTWSATGMPLIPPFTQAGSAQGGTGNVIPALHYALPLSNRWVFGFSVASPFGLNINYGSYSLLRYAANEADVQVYDFSPSIGFKVTDQFSVGAGFDAEYFNGTFDLTGGTPGPLAFFGAPPTTFDTLSHNTSTGWGYGWHAGLLYQFTPETRVGLAYRSKVSFNPHGTSNFSGPLAPGGEVTTNNHQLNVTLPPTTTLSAYHDFNQQWAIDGSVNYTQWSMFNNVLSLQNVLTPLPTTVSYPQHFRDTWRVAVGAQYHPVPQWVLRAGVGYDQTPMNTFNNALQIDGDRIGLAIGAHYQINKQLGVDGGWTHLFIRQVNMTTPSVSGAQTATPNGNVRSYADIVGMQLTWNIT